MGLLKINGHVTGKMLAGAMLKLHAATNGGLDKKKAAGVGLFINYLRENDARMEAWNKLTKLPPEAVIACASLNRKCLEEAGQLLEQTIDDKMRSSLLGQMIDPLDQGRRYTEVNASQLEPGLMPQLPEIELDMVGLPTGTFKMGSLNYRNEYPVKQITLSAYWIGKYEVTNAQYGIFMEQTGYGKPSCWNSPEFGKDNPKKPVVGVSCLDNETFAGWLGMQLPTEAQWEYAARGPMEFVYPWGNEWDRSKTTFLNQVGTRPVDAHPKGASPFGVFDMAGNVLERVADWYGIYDPHDLTDPKGPLVPKQNLGKVIRGASWRSLNPDLFRGANRGGCPPEICTNLIGFRVAADKTGEIFLSV